MPPNFAGISPFILPINAQVSFYRRFVFTGVFAFEMLEKHRFAAMREKDFAVFVFANTPEMARLMPSVGKLVSLAKVTF
ncbi:hypothetical protein, partial [Kingella kingae]|uniref:hypothetical protein n=1 Tax=Kingella kingae TaxID=504 RepID=UPI000570807B